MKDVNANSLTNVVMAKGMKTSVKICINRCNRNCPRALVNSCRVDVVNISIC